MTKSNVQGGMSREPNTSIARAGEMALKLWSQLDSLQHRMSLFEVLFMHSEERVHVLKRYLPSCRRPMDLALQRDLIISITALLERSTEAQPTVGFWRLLELAGFDPERIDDVELAPRIGGLRQHYKALEPIRNRMVAHDDERVANGLHKRPRVQIKTAQQAMADMKDALMCISRICTLRLPAWEPDTIAEEITAAEEKLRRC